MDELMLEELPRPEEQAGHYRFFKNAGTDRSWKVKLEFREAAPAMTSSNVELSAGQYTITVSASPVDSEGKALKDDQGRPIVTDSHGHTFNEIDMGQPDFDPEKLVMQLIQTRIAAGEAKLSATDKLKSFVTDWHQ
jgi:hypothetical protein